MLKCDLNRVKRTQTNKIFINNVHSQILYTAVETGTTYLL